ncbi:uncharacterized protein LOC141719035 [Apium graveolens]|uniref:uncharacterized protein LOC141719035 n=1 Tax=Apium graveolens TaxID=4045 RepID=UPI003D78D53C
MPAPNRRDVTHALAYLQYYVTKKIKENIDPASQNVSLRQNSDMSNNRLSSPVTANLINNFDEAYDGTHNFLMKINLINALFYCCNTAEAEPVDFPGIDLWEGYVNIGPPTSTCVKCGARIWNMEQNNKSNKNSSCTFSQCCKNGQVQLPPEKQPPVPLRSLLYGNDMTIHFKLNHILYNSLFVMCSGGGKIDHKINNGGAPYCFKVKGQNLYLLGSMILADGEAPNFFQVYIYDTENELENMINLIGGCRDEIDDNIVEALMDMLNQHNELVRQFHTARERFKDNEHDEFRLVLLSSQSTSGRTNIIVPIYEVGGLIVSTNGNSLGFRDRIVETHTNKLQRVWETDIFYAAPTIIRSDLYTSIQDALRKSNHDLNYVGKAVVLPASFKGSQRAIGHPSLLLTMTCNTKWSEINTMMKSLPGVDVCDVPDIVSRVFKLKLDHLMHLIKKKNYFGKCIGEFQKRGLSHMHMLIWLHPDARPKTVAQKDALVSAEIHDKDTDPVGYAAVSNYMIHGPCGVDNTYSPCMVKGKCMRHFPKRFNGNTYIDDCGLPIYLRCNTGRNIKKKGVFFGQ